METQGPGQQQMQAVVEMFNQGRHGEVEAQARDLTARYPLHGFGWKVLATVLVMQGREPEAFPALQKAAELLPGDAASHTNLGKVLADRGCFAEAEASYRRALELEPELVFAHNNLGAALADQGRFAEAAACYRRALEFQPDFAMAHNNLGNALCKQGRPVDAEASYRKALALTPDYAECHNNLGSALRDQRRFEDAELSYRRALAIKPEYADAHNNLGNALRDQGQLAEAEAAFRRAVELMPDSVDANVNLSAVLTQLVPLWHVPMMNDALRNEAYRAALRAAVTPDSNVLEIGTGSGLLAMIAARFGARQVVTCEAVPLIAATACDIVAANGLQSTVTVVAKMSTDVEVGVDLPQRANVMVSEILSSELLAEGVLASVEDAKRRLLEPAAKIIPAAGSIVFALFGGDAIKLYAEVDEVLGFDLSKFNAIAAPKRIVHRHDLDYGLLTDTAEAFAFDFVNRNYFPAESRTLPVPIKTAGVCRGVVQWIRLRLDDTVTFENHPAVATPASGWQICIYRFPVPVQVEPGQTALIRAAHNRTDVWFSWEGLEK